MVHRERGGGGKLGNGTETAAERQRVRNLTNELCDNCYCAKCIAFVSLLARLANCPVILTGNLKRILVTYFRSFCKSEAISLLLRPFGSLRSFLNGWEDSG